jgi:hypothetical protein
VIFWDHGRVLIDIGIGAGFGSFNWWRRNSMAQMQFVTLACAALLAICAVLVVVWTNVFPYGCSIQVIVFLAIYWRNGPRGRKRIAKLIGAKAKAEVVPSPFSGERMMRCAICGGRVWFAWLWRSRFHQICADIYLRDRLR